MRRFPTLSLFLFLFLPCLSSPVSGQQWNGILASSRAIDWSKAGATIPSGTIPACSTQPASNTVSAINAAIAADLGGSSYCKVNVPAGNYNVSGTLLIQYAGQANIILSGAGPDKTSFVWTGGGSSNCNGLSSTNLCVWNGDGSTNAGSGHWANSASVTGGLSKGSTTLTLQSVNNLKVGSEIQIAQRDSTSDNGSDWFCATTGSTGTCSQQGGTSAPQIGGSGATQSQMLVVTGCGPTKFGASCTSTSVTVNSPVYANNWSAANAPTASWSSTLPIANVGIQNMSFDVSGITARIVTECHDCSNVWFSGMRQINGTVTGQSATNHYIIWQSNHVTIENSYMYGSNPASEGYGIDWDAGTSDSLGLNNISQHVATGYITETGVANVYAYNYAVDNYFGSGWQQCDQSMHSAGDYFNLWEGNVGICAGGDDIHGTHFANTWFRTYLSGFDPATDGGGARYDNTMAFDDMAYTRYDNLVANVLGTVGFHKNYQNVGASGNPSNCSTANYIEATIFNLGFGDQNGIPFSPSCVGSNFTIDNDNLVASTIMRWGNFDAAHNSVQENSSETASNAPTFPGLSSPATTFPASFVFSSRPSWWAFPSGKTAPWPAIGPDVTGGNIANAGGHAWLNPAGNCYLNVMGGKVDGSSGPLTFSASTCYTGATPGPPAPVNLSGEVVQ